MPMKLKQDFWVGWAIAAIVIEAVMISTSSSQGISFVSPAKILKQHRMQK